MTEGPDRFAASVIVRSLNKEATIGDTLDGLRGQTVPIEIIVVDSGSSDRTIEIASHYADQIIEIAPAEFSYGYALNLGARAASSSILFALSAHCTPPSATWVEDSLNHYADPRIAGTNGRELRPDGSAAEGVYYPSESELFTLGTWDFSNHASSWRKSAWISNLFREDLGACEDKEWSWRVTGAGWRIAFDPLLTVSSGHRRHDGFLALWKRTYREAYALASLGLPPRPGLKEMLRQWWCVFPHASRWPSAARRFSPDRAAEHWAAWLGGHFGTIATGRVSGRLHPDPSKDGDARKRGA